MGLDALGFHNRHDEPSTREHGWQPLLRCLVAHEDDLPRAEGSPSAPTAALTVAARQRHRELRDVRARLEQQREGAPSDAAVGRKVV